MEGKKTWTDLKREELLAKGKDNWNEDDYEAWCYIECVDAMDEADADYLGHYLLIE